MKPKNKRIVQVLPQSPVQTVPSTVPPQWLNERLEQLLNSSWWASVKETVRICSIVTVAVVFGIIMCIVVPYIKDMLSEQRLKSLMKPMLPTKESAAAVCHSEECKRSALAALAMMNTSVDPCDDFYSYACGWHDENSTVPDEKVSVNSFSVVGDLLHDQLLSVVSEEIHGNEITPFKYAKNLYNMCMNTARIEEQGVKPLLDILESLGGWPVLEGDDWNADSSWSWMKSLEDLRMHGLRTDHFINFLVGTDLKNTNRRTIYVDQASLYVSRDHLVEGLTNHFVSEYYKSMVEIAVLLGADEARAKRELLESLDFEIALAKISLPIEERRFVIALYNPMSVKEFQQKYPFNNWVYYFNAMLKDTDIVIDAHEIIIVKSSSFLEKLGPLLEETPKRTLANYVMRRVVRFSSSFLTEKLQTRQLQIGTTFGGEKVQTIRSKECLDITASRLPISVGALYVRKYFNADSRHVALDMVNRIKNAFQNMLKTADWMDETTRKSALEKIDSILTHVGYPDELMIDRKITEYYNDLTFKPGDNFLKTVLYIDQLATTKALKKLRQAVNKTDWTTHSNLAVVNVRYSLIENSIQLTAGILQGQFFSVHRPKYINYGAIGSIIGHEITHSFDDQGRQYDKNGIFLDWWQTETEEAYLQKASCIIEQYGNYTEPNVNYTLNGINTRSENIADNVGLQQAYHAYRKWAEKNKPEPLLPDLFLTPEQMFWLSAAQTWCSVYRPKTMWTRVINGTYSPGQFRVVGSMSNLAEFANDFNCPAGSPMNPTEKCKVW